MNQFEPKIVAFLCNWCSYAGADKAGSSRKEFPANIEIIRVMCSGRVDPQFVLKAFEKGADGVLILGCHPGDCHYKSGNYNALKRWVFLKKILSDFGISSKRVELDWVSSSESDKFIKITTEMYERIRKLGPLKDYQYREEV